MLVDTNVWSELSRPHPDDRVCSWFAANLSTCMLSSIVLAEMRYGVALAEGQRRDTLDSFVSDIATRLTDRIVDFDAEAAAVWGAMRARLQRSGTLIGECDMFIAAQAMARGVPLVTRNVSDMARTGAIIVNPWEG
ncbi:PIN domain-containing protein [Sphingomonas adhaesiva]|uniref:PIN domain-containing protein n=1 Tax=Sphingomonas adhaesiva TaxID=28212 RepID=UPI002FF83933